MYDTVDVEQEFLVWFEREVGNLDEAAVALQEVVVDVVEEADVVAADGGNDVAVVVVVEEGNDEAIVLVQGRHDEMVVGEYNFVGCKSHIDYFGKANVVDTRPSSEPDVGQGAE